MNGIDAVSVALGQDWRAIESAAHSFASITGRYLPLTVYEIRKDILYGRLEIPISVGSKGGAMETNPSFKNTMTILGNPTSAELA
jgi:hydroxymethylglutaryl-CoA reductase